MPLPGDPLKPASGAGGPSLHPREQLLLAHGGQHTGQRKALQSDKGWSFMAAGHRGPTLPLQDTRVKVAPVGAPQPPALKPTSTETQTPEVSGLGLGSQLCPGLPWEPGPDRLLGPQFPLLYRGVRHVIPRALPAWTTIGESDHNWPPLFLSVAREGQAASCSISCRLRDSL